MRIYLLSLFFVFLSDNAGTTTFNCAREMRCLRHKIHANLFVSLLTSNLGWILIAVLQVRKGRLFLCGNHFLYPFNTIFYIPMVRFFFFLKFSANFQENVRFFCFIPKNEQLSMTCGFFY